jgi:hypothetical protein
MIGVVPRTLRAGAGIIKVGTFRRGAPRPALWRGARSVYMRISPAFAAAWVAHTKPSRRWIRPQPYQRRRLSSVSLPIAQIVRRLVLFLALALASLLLEAAGLATAAALSS